MRIPRPELSAGLDLFAAANPDLGAHGYCPLGAAEMRSIAGEAAMPAAGAAGPPRVASACLTRNGSDEGRPRPHRVFGGGAEENPSVLAFFQTLRCVSPWKKECRIAESLRRRACAGIR